MDWICSALRKDGVEFPVEISLSLVDQHKSFETPCGAYAHFKLTRSLLRVTRDPRYGDSMERVMYNTVLGAKPLQPDGTAFYYSDYSFQGHKGYSNHHWPCCSGTLPQVAADYRINAYFHDAQDLYVNLYIPSTARWNRAGTDIELRQTTEYPYEDVVNFELTASRPEEFNINFRVPAWSTQASLSVNGKPAMIHLTPGHFPPLRRRWKSGDRIELHLPMTTRLEAIDAQLPDTVALMYGPLVLFPITNAAPPLMRKQLLAAKRSGAQSWQIETASGPLTLPPFTEITDEAYTTYMRVT